MSSVDVGCLVEDTIVTDVGRSIDDVCGMDEVKAALKDHVISPLKTGSLTCPLRILLCGAPGTGKSYLVRSLAKDILPVPMYACHCCDLISKWYGEVDFRRKLFQHAASRETGAVMLLDELETICTPHYANLFEVLIEELVKLPPNVVVIINSLRPWTIPANFLPVFNKILYTPVPDREARANQIRSLLKDHLSPNDDDLGILADIAEGLTAADITCFIQEAVKKPVRDLMEASFFVEKDGKMTPCDADTEGCIKTTAFDLIDLPDAEDKVSCRPLSLSDIRECLSRARPSTSEEEIGQFEEFLRQNAR
ncbi:vacuolar protein sorting-associated protein 4-like [Lineus longissimus]|uniref:vacuolar protein sorting-associated protein 4-like n=1 Tax=Lineus longissimus TaxID=88925 RepID=UPI002B4EB0D2